MHPFEMWQNSTLRTLYAFAGKIPISARPIPLAACIDNITKPGIAAVDLLKAFLFEGCRALRA